MLDFIFKNKSIKKIYLLGWEVDFDNSRHCINFLRTQKCIKELVESQESGLELVFENKELIEVNEFGNPSNYIKGEWTPKNLKKNEIGFQYQEIKENKFLQLEKNNKGLHYLGGEIPNDFKIPTGNFKTEFQYLGLISAKDSNFTWLGFDFHIICPIFLEFEDLYLDYSNPNAPKIFNIDEIEKSTTSFNELSSESEITYDEVQFSFTETIDYNSTVNSGIPIYMQFSYIPDCPISGNSMRFLCQIHRGTVTKRTNIIPENDWNKHYFDKLDIRCGADLYVFYEPTTKIACYFIQGT